MRCDNHPRRFYCGVDLHARRLYTHVLDARGKTVLDKDLPASPAAFLDAGCHSHGLTGAWIAFGIPRPPDDP
jgi:hypothetical protein